MKKIDLIIITFILFSFSCKKGGNKKLADTKQELKSGKIKEKKSCIIGFENLDTLSRWQSKSINPENVENGYLLLSAHITSSENNYGIITFMNTSDSVATLFFVKTIDNHKNYLVLGTKDLGKLKSNYSIQSMCSSDCNLSTLITGLITFDKNSNTKTIKAWSIDKEKGRLVKLDKDNINCTDAFNTDYD